MEIKKVRLSDAQYPALLRRIPGAPKQLYYIGDIGLAGSLCVSIVGSRKCTDYGKWAAMRLAERLAEHDVTVVSGLAMGIDSAAHKGALRGGGKTIAVLGNGADICFPAANRQLKQVIERDGLVVTEYPPGMAFLMNEQTENIGARRLHTIIEKLLEDISFNLPDPSKDKIVVDREYVEQKFKEKIHPVELDKFIL